MIYPIVLRLSCVGQVSLGTLREGYSRSAAVIEPQQSNPHKHCQQVPSIKRKWLKEQARVHHSVEAEEVAVSNETALH